MSQRDNPAVVLGGAPGAPSGGDQSGRDHEPSAPFERRRQHWPAGCGETRSFGCLRAGSCRRAVNLLRPDKTVRPILGKPANSQIKPPNADVRTRADRTKAFTVGKDARRKRRLGDATRLAIPICQQEEVSQVVHVNSDTGYIPHMSTGFVPLFPKLDLRDKTRMKTINEEIVERVLAQAEKLGKSMREISLQSGHADGLIRDWKRDKAPLPRIDSLQKVANVLGVKAGWLAFGDDADDHETDFRSVPVISWVAASKHAEPGHVDDAVDAPHILVDKHLDHRAFALRVVGDSMNHIAPEGSLIIVDPSERELMPRKFYVFADEQGATFKRFMHDPDRLEPFSTNPAHEALSITPSTRVVGKVVRVVVDI